MPAVPIRPALRPPALAIAIAGLTLAACAGGSGLQEPSSTGRYGVGMTEQTFTRTSTTRDEPRTLDTVIWYPAGGGAGGEPERDVAPSDDGPFPVVIFSHGSSGEPEHLSYLTEHLASWGFVVVAPPHPGNTRQDGECDIACLGDSYLNRVDDVTFTLDQVLALDEPLAAAIDAERTAVMGFSFGGMTAVRAAPEHRFDAIVGLAPAAPGSLIEIGEALDVPILVASGGEDLAVPADQVLDFFEALPEGVPHYGITFPKGKHTNFQNDCQEGCELSQERAHELIDRYVTAFLVAYVRGDDDRYLRFLDDAEPPDVELLEGGT